MTDHREFPIKVYIMRGGRREAGIIWRSPRSEHGKLVVTYCGSVYEVKGDKETGGYYIEI